MRTENASIILVIADGNVRKSPEGIFEHAPVFMVIVLEKKNLFSQERSGDSDVQSIGMYGFEVLYHVQYHGLMGVTTHIRDVEVSLWNHPSRGFRVRSEAINFTNSRSPPSGDIVVKRHVVIQVYLFRTRHQCLKRVVTYLLAAERDDVRRQFLEEARHRRESEIKSCREDADFLILRYIKSNTFDVVIPGAAKRPGAKDQKYIGSSDTRVAHRAIIDATFGEQDVRPALNESISRVSRIL